MGVKRKSWWVKSEERAKLSYMEYPQVSIWLGPRKIDQGPLLIPGLVVGRNKKD
jgi:hypothetical protein